MEKQRNYESPLFHWGVPNGSAGKESILSAGDTGDTGSIPWSGRSAGGGKWQPTHSSILPEKSHGQRSLVGYSLKAHKESDMTERLSTSTLLGQGIQETEAWLSFQDTGGKNV